MVIGKHNRGTKQVVKEASSGDVILNKKKRRTITPCKYIGEEMIGQDRTGIG